ncbi:MAG: Ig-like domain-containing protein [bacterium]
MPDANAVWQSIKLSSALKENTALLQNATSTVTKCPNVTIRPNGYVFNSMLSGVSLGSAVNGDPTSVWMTADGYHTNAGTAMPNVAFSMEDLVADRHASNFISSALDGHVEMNKGSAVTTWNDKAGSFKLPATAATANLLNSTPQTISSGTPYEFISDQAGPITVSGAGLTSNDYSVTTNGIKTQVTINKPTGTYTITSGSINKLVTLLGPPDNTNSTIAADKLSIGNDGVEKSTITLTVKDVGSSPLPNVAVTISGGTTNPQSGSTNASGIFTTTFATTNAGTATIVATFGPTATPITKPITITVNVVPIPLATFNFDTVPVASLNTIDGPYTPDFASANMTVSNLTAGAGAGGVQSGIHCFGTAAGPTTPCLVIGTFAASNLHAGAIANNCYGEFSVTPQAGKTINLTTFSLNAKCGGSSNCPRGWFVQYSRNGDDFTTHQIINDVSYPGATTFAPYTGTIGLTGLTSADTIRFRIYMWVTGTPVNRNLQFDDISVLGIVQ